MVWSLFVPASTPSPIERELSSSKSVHPSWKLPDSYVSKLSPTDIRSVNGLTGNIVAFLGKPPVDSPETNPHYSSTTTIKLGDKYDVFIRTQSELKSLIKHKTVCLQNSVLVIERGQNLPDSLVMFLLRECNQKHAVAIELSDSVNK